MKMVAQSSHAVYTNSTACGKQIAGQLLQSHPALVFQLFLNQQLDNSVTMVASEPVGSCLFSALSTQVTAWWCN